MARIILFALALALSAVPAAPAAAREAEPKQAKGPGDVRPGHGVVILSVRSQDQLFGKLSIWFEAADETARAGADHVKFERKQGVPIAGYNMIDLRPWSFSVPAGRWRLLAHTVRCGQLPPPDAICSVTGAHAGLYPTGRYDGSSILLDVRPGSVFDAGDLMLEFPAGTELKGPKLKRQSIMRLKWKPLPPAEAARVAARFPGLPVRRLEGVAADEASAVRCTDDKAKIHHGLTLPFDC